MSEINEESKAPVEETPTAVETINEEKVSVQPEDITKLYVAPHNKPSRLVTEADIERVIADAEKMHKLCHTPHGIYPAALAIAHTQIDDKDPLAFFVVPNGDIIVNPRIIRHTDHLKEDIEGCLSYPDKMLIRLGRWYKIEAEFYTISADKHIIGPTLAKLKGMEARMFQHEFSHILGINIYDDNYTEKFIKAVDNYGSGISQSVQ